MKKILSYLAIVLLSTCTAIPAQAWVFAPYNFTLTPTNGTQQAYKVLGVCSLLDFDPNFPTEGETTQGVTIKNWLLDCQKKAINLGAANNSNLVMPSCIGAITSGLTTFGIALNTPEVFPRYVCPSLSVTFKRDGSSGTPIANWNGDATTKQLSNLYQPFFIMSPQGIMPGILRAVLNSNGTDRGSGLFYGRTWRMAQLTPQAGGTGFVGGETCTVANGDLSPATGATFTCAHATAGACDSITFAPTQWQSTTGMYYLPPVLQRQQWAVNTGCNACATTTCTAAENAAGLYNNCWDGHDSKHPQVFDNDTNHYYLTTCSGAGANLTVSALYWPDWCSGAAADSDTVSCAINTSGINGQNAYDGTFGNYSASTGFINQAYLEQSGNSHDATYGYTYGFFADAAEFTANYIQTQKAHFGLVLLGSDTVIGHHNDVGSAIQEYVGIGGSLHILEARLDTPTDTLNNDAHAINLVKCDNCDITGNFFHNTNSAADVGSPYVRTCDDAVCNSTNENSNVKISGDISSDGSGGSNLTAFDCKYTRGSTFDLRVSNIGRNGSARAQQFTNFVNFNTNCESGNVFRGNLDNVDNMPFTGTLPAVDMQVVNSKTGSVPSRCKVVAAGYTGYVNHNIATNQETSVLTVQLPPMGPKTFLKGYTIWERSGTLTDSMQFTMRFASSGCTVGTLCTNGTKYIDFTGTASNQAIMQIPFYIFNAGATNSQKAMTATSVASFNGSGTLTTGAINSSLTPTLNFNCNTITTLNDTCQLDLFEVEACEPIQTF